MPVPPTPTDDPRPEPPLRPDDDACCGSGCDPCIFDFYAEELQKWRADLAAWEAREAARQAAAAAATPAADAQEEKAAPAGKPTHRATRKQPA